MLHFREQCDFPRDSAWFDRWVALPDRLDGILHTGDAMDAFSHGAVVTRSENSVIDVIFVLDVADFPGDGGIGISG